MVLVILVIYKAVQMLFISMLQLEEYMIFVVNNMPDRLLLPVSGLLGINLIKKLKDFIANYQDVLNLPFMIRE
jgi:hypothetical protein